MLSYEFEASILIIRASGESTPEDRQLLLRIIREDPQIPQGSPVLLDLRKIDVTCELTPAERFSLMVEQLGPKMGWVCALLPPSKPTDETKTFQVAGGSFGLRVEVFHDESSARKWLARFQSNNRRASRPSG